jgi:short-subunit dehydrogenase
MNAFIFGGSAGVGRQLCRALAARGENLVIVSRDLRDLESEAAHCRAVYGVEVDCIAVDAADPCKVVDALSSYLVTNDRIFHHLLLPVGGSMFEDNVRASLDSIQRSTNTNLASVMAAVGVLLPRIAAKGVRTIVGFSSVAAIRGRNSNVAYSAAKRGLESYFESLRHELATAGVRVQLYRLGYVDTQQSFGRKLAFHAAAPEAIARIVVSSLGRDFGRRSLPRFWSLVGMALPLLPWGLFRRLRF